MGDTRAFMAIQVGTAGMKDDWHALGWVRARSERQARERAAVRWPGRRLVVMSPHGFGVSMPPSRWIKEANDAEAAAAAASRDASTSR